ncbi:toprim domain-containing protein [Phenylobacterium sp.]|uniref:toprim domain-containing protein n=1 Tax=Phenylobacterium sp. TaxID=1871053 RepID=UPI002FC6061A
MTLHAIAAALGGDLYARGLRANIPAPGHSARDRSVSLLLHRGRVVAHSFGDADWRAVLDDLRARGLVDAAGAPTGGVGRVVPDQDLPAAARMRLARDLWDAGLAIGPNSLAARHGRLRGVARSLASVADLRIHAAAPVSVYRPGRTRRPALLAAIRGPDGALEAVEITYLDARGRRAGDLRLPRKTVGRLPPGCAVRLDPAAATLLVAEGVFTALSAGERFGLPAWALLSTGNLRRWLAPPGVRRVVVAADRGLDGERSATLLAERLRAQGLRASVRPPPPPFGDWNEVATAGGEGRAGEGARTAGKRSQRPEPEIAR